jgi:hypothetical protein
VATCGRRPEERYGASPENGGETAVVGTRYDFALFSFSLKVDLASWNDGRFFAAGCIKPALSSSSLLFFFAPVLRPFFPSFIAFYVLLYLAGYINIFPANDGFKLHDLRAHSSFIRVDAREFLAREKEF